MTLENNFFNNLEALSNVNTVLYNQLKAITINTRFEIDVKNSDHYNIYDNASGSYIDTNSTVDANKKLSDYKILEQYPYLYFFGIGNGTLIQRLLHSHSGDITVVEPEIEILFIALHCHDFSNDISTGKLTLFLNCDIDYPFLISFLNQSDRVYYIKSYTLHFPSEYYQNYFSEQIADLHMLILKAMKFIIFNAGNSIQDALEGLQHHIYNLPYMISGPQLSKFVTQKNAETVIMVSTGPSLTKQLPLLKSIQKHTCIICADSALRILHQWDIVPDICVSMERIEFVAKLFEDLPSDYKKQVIFVRASLEHKAVFKTLYGCHDILAIRPYPYNKWFKSEPYGPLCSGMSVANMAHELSIYMHFKRCIIIGQDLAYGIDGKTHSKGHILGENDSSVQKAALEVTAYGGNGTVPTTEVWDMFLSGLRQTVAASSLSMPTINSTEGGARIDGTIEMPFSEAVKQFVDFSHKKIPIIPIQTPIDEARFYLKRAYDAVEKLLSEGEKFQKEVEKVFTYIADNCKQLEHKTQEEQVTVFSDNDIMSMLDAIEKLRAQFTSNQYFKSFYWEIMQPLTVHHEIELGSIRVLYVSNPNENKHKAIRWIFNHISYLFTIAGSLEKIRETIRESKRNSLDELPDNLASLLQNH